MVECNLAKVEVASSNLVSRSIQKYDRSERAGFFVFLLHFPFLDIYQCFLMKTDQLRYGPCTESDDGKVFPTQRLVREYYELYRSNCYARKKNIPQIHAYECAFSLSVGWDAGQKFYCSN
ncbi:conserved protein of unknown function [Pseudodesulfovibrio piezophilus C1TLV30]|uniref:Uncharacterized protein n=1 Tax=Pseudodesulfovibrio piezophilus (strain DSM 21447 / JCM 15486 / C1TLV30) TaxID=1322246 RepID=M1WUH5_PSEP2|nr:conserved protein of unknown function [Pseudodesulfovibrio piezophilus C1TLV30]